MLKIRRLKWMTGIIVFVMSFLATEFAHATESPTEAIKETIDAVFTILHDPALRGEEKREKRSALLRKTVTARFDFREMAKRALGFQWERNKTKQDQFAALFTDLLGAVYLDTIEWGVKAKVFYLREYFDDEYAHVDTKIVPSDRNSLKVSYKLHVIEGEWKAYDVLIENMSLMRNYRSQFYRVLGRHSFDELLEMLKKKIENLRRLSHG